MDPLGLCTSNNIINRYNPVMQAGFYGDPLNFVNSNGEGSGFFLIGMTLNDLSNNGWVTRVEYGDEVMASLYDAYYKGNIQFSTGIEGSGEYNRDTGIITINPNKVNIEHLPGVLFHEGIHKAHHDRGDPAWREEEYEAFYTQTAVDFSNGYLTKIKSKKEIDDQYSHIPKGYDKFRPLSSDSMPSR